MLLTAKTQRWTPEETLRVLVDLEIAARDESNCRAPDDRRPVPRRQDPRRVQPRRVLDPHGQPRLPRSPWTGSAAPTTCASSARPAPARATTSSPSAAPPSKPDTRSATSPPSSSSNTSTAPSPTTPSAAPSSSLPQRADHHRRDRLRPARPHRLPTAVPAHRRRLRTPLRRHRLTLPFEQWGRFLPDQPTAVSLLDRLCHHAHIITTSGDSYRLTHRTTGGEEPRREDFLGHQRGPPMATSEDIHMAVDNREAPT